MQKTAILVYSISYEMIETGLLLSRRGNLAITVDQESLDNVNIMIQKVQDVIINEVLGEAKDKYRHINPIIENIIWVN